MTWVRPDHVPFPNVWERFQGKVMVNGKPLQYRIQDITEELIQPVLEHITRYVVVREVCNAHEGISEDEDLMKILREFWKQTMNQKMGLVAIVEGNEDECERIAGVNILSVIQDTDPKLTFQLESGPIKRLMFMFRYFYEKENLFKKYGVNKYLNGFGLNVAPQYQGDSIGYYLLKARTPLCQTCGIPVTITLFTHPAAIHEALKDGFHKVRESSSNEITIDNELLFPRIRPARVFTLAAKVIPKIPNEKCLTLETLNL